MTQDTPSELQLDALREVANVGCGHAANALSQLVGGRVVRIDVPHVSLVNAAQMATLVGGADAEVVAALLTLQGELGGCILLVLPAPGARALAALLVDDPPPPGGELSELEKSALGEAANIVASACLSAIGNLAQLKLLPSPPTLVHDQAEGMLRQALATTRAPQGLLLVLEARFQAVGMPELTGQLLVLPDRASLAKLLTSLGV
ncbi:MAG: chemotaxis protein CheC [Myxococcota bacterium]